MAASTITRGTFVDGTTPWNSSNISSLIYDRIDQMFGGVGGYATLELGGALKINGALTQLSNDGGALGTSSLGWSDLFLASGGVINWNNGDVTLTHSTDALAFAGAANGYTFANGPVRPATNDGAALGTTATQWSDLFLASGGVINFDNGDVTVTHSTNTLTFAGATSGYNFADGPLKTPTTVSVGNATPASTGAGITFPAAQSASSDANTLDDYEEGTFTPTIGTSGTQPSSVTYVTQLGRYTKVGRLVFVECNVEWSASTGSPTGRIRVNLNDIPFNSASTPLAGAAITFISGIVFGTPGTPTLYMNNSAKTLDMFTVPSAGGSAQDVAWDSSGTVWFTACYTAA